MTPDQVAEQVVTTWQVQSCSHDILSLEQSKVCAESCLVELIATALAKEREACAAVAESYVNGPRPMRQGIAADIRARRGGT